jgi:hypothetical protein
MHVRARSWLCLGVLLALSACRNRVGEPGDSVAPTNAPAVSAPKKLLRELPPGRAGDWVNTRHYRLRVLDVFPCDGDAAPAPRLVVDEHAEPDTRPPSATTPGKPGHYRLGVALEVEANDTVFATPKGFALVKNGKVFFATMDPRPSAACQALLKPRSLRSTERASGIVVFEAPEPEYLTGATLEFRPPRWGYESKAGVVLPSCFGEDCPDAKPQAEAKL